MTSDFTFNHVKYEENTFEALLELLVQGNNHVKQGSAGPEGQGWRSEGRGGTLRKLSTWTPVFLFSLTTTGSDRTSSNNQTDIRQRFLPAAFCNQDATAQISPELKYPLF